MLNFYESIRGELTSARRYKMEAYRMRNSRLECALPELDPLTRPGTSRSHGYLKLQRQQQRALAVVEEEGQCRRSGRVRQAPTPIYVPGVVAQSRYYRTELCLGETFQVSAQLANGRKAAGSLLRGLVELEPLRIGLQRLASYMPTTAR